MKTTYQPENFGEAVGLRLADIREAAEFNQIQTAKACHITQETMSRIESGKLPLMVLQVVQLAELFGMPANALALDLIKAANRAGF